MKLFLWLILSIPSSLAFTSSAQGRPRLGKNAQNDRASRRSYANLSDPPINHATTQSFESRMRQLVLSPKPPSSRAQRRPPSTAPDATVRTISNLSDYKRVVTQERCHKLTVVRFYADYCRSCRAMKPAFVRLARRHQEAVQWAQVPVTAETAKIHQGLQVPSVPFGHIYHAEAGLVEELRLRKEFVPAFAQILQSYQQGECELPSEPNPETGIYEAPYVRHV